MKIPIYRHVVGLGEAVGLVQRWLTDDDLHRGVPRLSAGGAFVLHLSAEGGSDFCSGTGPCVHALHKDDILDCAGPGSSAPWLRMRARFQDWALLSGFVVEDGVADGAASFVSGLFGAASEPQCDVSNGRVLVVDHDGETMPPIEAIRRLLDPLAAVQPGGADLRNALAERLAEIVATARPSREA